MPMNPLPIIDYDLKPVPKLKKAASTRCPVCGSGHELAGAYVCVECNQVVCTRHYSYMATDVVIPKHGRLTDEGKIVYCGPAIRLIGSEKTRVTIKVSK